MHEFHTRNTENNAPHRSVFREISSSNLLHGIGFRVWEVEANDIQYQYDEGHTLSLYLKGGEQTFRRDTPSLKGSAGKLCLMPQGHWSQWHSPRPISIAHLYIPDDFIRQQAERHLDIDSRLANLKDVIYDDNICLQTAMMDFITCVENQKYVDALFGEQRLLDITNALLSNYCEVTSTNKKLKKGLSKLQRNLIKNHIHERLSEKVTIDELASVLHMSAYHFARSFKLSFGDSPANYIIRSRIEKAKVMLKNQNNIASLAIDCGFSHQSHLTNYFKKHMGVTPAQYRSSVQKNTIHSFSVK